MKKQINTKGVPRTYIVQSLNLFAEMVAKVVEIFTGHAYIYIRRVEILRVSSGNRLGLFITKQFK
jgi:hypothetical protein